MTAILELIVPALWVLGALLIVVGPLAMAQYHRQTQLKIAKEWKPQRLSIATVHDGLVWPERWDESQWRSVHPDAIYGGFKTGAYPMVMQLKDGPDPLDEDTDVGLAIIPGRELGEFPNLSEHMSREPLVTAPEPTRSRFADKTFTIVVPRELVTV